MKNISKMLLVAALAVPFSAAAQKKGGKVMKKQPAKSSVVAADIVPVVTAAPVDAKDFSYAIGVAQGEGLKNYLLSQEGVDSAYLYKTAEGLTKTFSEKERKEIIALAAGLKIQQMNEERIIANINETFSESPTSGYLDAPVYNQAMSDYLTGKELRLSVDSANKLVAQQQEYKTQTYRAENALWLAQNKTKEGVVTTASGLQYKVLTKGTGPLPSDTATVEVNYEGKLINGNEFDSSYKRGKTTKFPIDGVIKGWTEALKLMPEGSVWELYIPQELGYGERGSGRNIPPYSTLIFKVELVNANAPADKKVPRPGPRR